MAEEKILERVRKLLERAEHPGTPEPERDACIAKADALMLKHAIDEAVLDATKRDDRRQPISRRFRAVPDLAYRDKMGTIMYYMQNTTRTKVAMHTKGEVTVVGMPDDVDFYERVWTSVYFTFVSKINPSWDDNMSFDHNVYNFKKAGYKWPEIRDKAMRANHHVPWPDGGLLIRAYKRHAKAVGDDHQVKTQRHAAYRESFAEGFVRSVCSRLEAMKEEQEAQISTSGAELALVDVATRVEDEYYNLFPSLRPMTDEEIARLRKERAEREVREAAELQAKLDAMTDKQRAAWERKQEEQRRKEAAASDRYWRKMSRERMDRFDSDGVTAGKRAGEQVDLGRTGVASGSTPRGVL